MSEKKDGNVSKRFFVKATEDLFKRLQHLAIDMGEPGVETLAGKLLEEIVQSKERERNDAPRKRK